MFRHNVKINSLTRKVAFYYNIKLYIFIYFFPQSATSCAIRHAKILRMYEKKINFSNLSVKCMNFLEPVICHFMKYITDANQGGNQLNGVKKIIIILISGKRANGQIQH